VTGHYIKGTSGIFRPGTATVGVTGIGALMERQGGFSSMANNTIVRGDTVGNLSAVYDDGLANFGASFIQTMPGTGYLSNTSVGFQIPTGADGRYDLEFFFYLLGTGTSFPVQWGFRADDDLSGSYIASVALAAGTFAHYSGMSNSGVSEAAATVVASGVPLVAGDRFVWFARQSSGAGRTIDYVRWSLKKVA